MVYIFCSCCQFMFISVLFVFILSLWILGKYVDWQFSGRRGAPRPLLHLPNLPSPPPPSLPCPALPLHLYCFLNFQPMLLKFHYRAIISPVLFQTAVRIFFWRATRSFGAASDRSHSRTSLPSVPPSGPPSRSLRTPRRRYIIL